MTLDSVPIPPIFADGNLPKELCMVHDFIERLICGISAQGYYYDKVLHCKYCGKIKPNKSWLINLIN